jgi:hypothetical protein
MKNSDLLTAASVLSNPKQRRTVNGKQRQVTIVHYKVEGGLHLTQKIYKYFFLNEEQLKNSKICCDPYYLGQDLTMQNN